MIVLEKMVDLSPLYISLKTAIITIVITFFNENYFRWYFYHASYFTTNSYGIFLINDLWG